MCHGGGEWAAGGRSALSTLLFLFKKNKNIFFELVFQLVTTRKLLSTKDGGTRNQSQSNLQVGLKFKLQSLHVRTTGWCLCPSQGTFSSLDHGVILWPERLKIPSCVWCYFSLRVHGGRGNQAFPSLSPCFLLSITHLIGCSGLAKLKLGVTKNIPSWGWGQPGSATVAQFHMNPRVRPWGKSGGIPLFVSTHQHLYRDQLFVFWMSRTTFVSRKMTFGDVCHSCCGISSIFW